MSDRDGWATAEKVTAGERKARLGWDGGTEGSHKEGREGGRVGQEEGTLEREGKGVKGKYEQPVRHWGRLVFGKFQQTHIQIDLIKQAGKNEAEHS